MSLTSFFMIAVIEIGGKQYTVTPESTIVVDRQNIAEGENLVVTPLLVASEDGKTVNLGAPFVEGAKVTLRVDSHQRGEKIRVFKMKAKKRYVRSRGFRPSETTLTVTSIA